MKLFGFGKRRPAEIGGPEERFAESVEESTGHIVLDWHQTLQRFDEARREAARIDLKDIDSFVSIRQRIVDAATQSPRYEQLHKRLGAIRANRYGESHIQLCAEVEAEFEAATDPFLRVALGSLLVDAFRLATERADDMLQRAVRLAANEDEPDPGGGNDRITNSGK